MMEVNLSKYFYNNSEISSESVESKRTLEETVKNDLKVVGKGNVRLFIILISCFLGNALFYSALFFDNYALRPPQNFYCQVTQLKNAGWTDDQIQQVAQAGSCDVYNFNYTQLTQMSFDDALEYTNTLLQSDQVANDTISCQTAGKFIYESSEGVTFSADNDLVCGNEERLIKVMSAFNTGCALGGILFGIIGDRFGRKLGFNISILSFIVTTFLTSFAQNTSMYWWLRFASGFFGVGMSNVLYVILIENCQSRVREVFTILYSLSYPFGFLLITLDYDVLKNWRNAQMAFAALALAVFGISRTLTESPRFLISKSKHAEAYKALHGINPNPSHFLTESTENSQNDESHNTFKSFELTKFFFSSKFFIFTWICIFFNFFWFFATGYIDIQVDIDNTFNRTLFFAPYDAIATTISLIFFVALMRKHFMIFLLMIFGSMTILAEALPSESKMQVQFAYIFCRSLGLIGAFLIGLQIIEIFPTEIRNTAYGVATSIVFALSFECFNFITLPYADLTDNFGFPSFMTVFGLFSIFACVFILLLPETKEMALRDRMNEVIRAENINDDEKAETEESSSISIASIVVFAVAMSFIGYEFVIGIGDN